MLRVYQILVSIFILYTHLTIRVKTENFDNPRHVVDRKWFLLHA